MRHSKRTHCPDWDSRESWGHESYSGSHKRKRRSHSSTQENRHCKPHHQFKESDCHYLEARSLNERDYRDRRYIDEYRNDYCEGYVPRHYHRDIESSYRIHCSKSSVRSRRSSPKRKPNRHFGSSHHSRSKSHRRKRSRSIEDDEEGHLICQSGDVLRARYEIVDTLGEGAFGKVVECIDHGMDGMHVAVKIVKNVGRYREAARSEIQVLEHLNSTDPNSVFRCVQMLEWFDHHGHVCIVFELLGLSTYDFIKENSFLPFQIDHIRQMAYQICQSINFLHHNKLTHTDLKPENILFVKSDYVVKYNSKMVNWDEHSSAGRYVRRRCKPLKEFMLCHDEEHEKLFDLVRRMLEYDPTKRITLDEALQHPFFDLLKRK
uniref:dual-specificity kinase n=1 Tax=Prolemur simus TaxID=1328070 RepID=A0A8C8ZDE0_PROSS